MTHGPHGPVYQSAGKPVDVYCDFRVLDTGTVPTDGLRTSYDARALVRGEWPGGPHDNTSLVDYNGTQYVINGFPVRRDGSPRTAHWQVNLNYVKRAG